MRIRLQTSRRPRGKRPQSKLNIAFLSLPAHHVHFSTQLAQQLDSLPVAAAASVADENASVENQWCQLRDTVRTTALTVLGRARHQQQDWFDDNDEAISNPFVENRLHEAYVTQPSDDNKVAFYLSRRLMQQWLQEMWTLGRLARPKGSKGTRSATNRRISSPRSRLSTVRQPKELLFSAPTEILYSPRRHKQCSDGPSTSEASSTVPRPSPTRHRSSASSGDQRQSRPPVLSPRNHQGREAALQWGSARIGRDLC
nr:unnamed protein product [Spirometra erinaceieuropaei]